MIPLPIKAATTTAALIARLLVDLRYQRSCLLSAIEALQQLAEMRKRKAAE